MGFGLYIENMVHKRTYAGNEATTHINRITWLTGTVPSDAPAGTVPLRKWHGQLDGVYPVGDTMFNTWQLRQLGPELDALAELEPEAAEDIAAFKRIVGGVIRDNGYLWIVGD